MIPFDAATEADRCVKCGQCLPSCPTYQLQRHEAESPRGRIALIQGLLDGQLQYTGAARAHLDSCLLCRACERACPSGVRYGRLLDGARQQFARGHNRSLDLLTNRRLLRAASSVGRVASAMGVRARGQAQRMLRLLPGNPPGDDLFGSHAAIGPARARVGLFTGCIGEQADHGALAASIQLLRQLGVETLVPQAQGCCGAMHLHNGERTQAEQLARSNLAAFSGQQLDAILFVGSGCGLQLTEYAELIGEDLPAPPMEVAEFVVGLDDWRQRFALSPEPVWLHTPCSQHSRPGAVAALRELLQSLGADIHEPADSRCCGAAGQQLLTQPELADRLLEPKLAQLAQEPALPLLTSNTGCALHFAAGLREAGLSIAVMHPVQWLAGRLAATTAAATE